MLTPNSSIIAVRRDQFYSPILVPGLLKRLDAYIDDPVMIRPYDQTCWFGTFIDAMMDRLRERQEAARSDPSSAAPSLQQRRLGHPRLLPCEGPVKIAHLELMRRYAVRNNMFKTTPFSSVMMKLDHYIDNPRLICLYDDEEWYGLFLDALIIRVLQRQEVCH